jgi:hypothetical protein
MFFLFSIAKIAQPVQSNVVRWKTQGKELGAYSKKNERELTTTASYGRNVI